MSIEVIDFVLAERQHHPRLAGRITGKVRATLIETIGEKELQHELLVPVWVDVEDDISDEDIELRLKVKAAEIVGRLKRRLAASGEAAE